MQIQADRLPEGRRAQIDGEIEALLDEAERFARASAGPDPVDALDFLYASGLRGRAGTA